MAPAWLEITRSTWYYAGAVGIRLVAGRSTNAAVRAADVGKLARSAALAAGAALIWRKGARAAG